MENTLPVGNLLPKKEKGGLVHACQVSYSKFTTQICHSTPPGKECMQGWRSALAELLPCGRMHLRCTFLRSEGRRVCFTCCPGKHGHRGTGLLLYYQQKSQCPVTCFLGAVKQEVGHLFLPRKIKQGQSGPGHGFLIPGYGLHSVVL